MKWKKAVVASAISWFSIETIIKTDFLSEFRWTFQYKCNPRIIIKHQSVQDGILGRVLFCKLEIKGVN